MSENFALTIQNMKKKQLAMEIKKCNEVTMRYGVTLSDTQIENLINKRFESLKSTGRVEFGDGILKELIEAFCDSPYIIQENYEETLEELQDIFYFFKGEAMDQIADDELIEFMKEYFNGECQGSIEYLSGTNLEELCRDTRYGLNRER
ncbi:MULTISPECIES: DUF6323 family protein [Clostridium]|uniref:DUF6323 family protein n=1 Tax=Clostridium TaxID=1485 RepID=UPI000822E8D0|nr:DUF6323 family protein [Clostridium saudiense]MDU7455287.1 DUF6323 family protein [Clostridium saudiense]SCJ92498.1 Uncharacterised protein [uncultured Clostridium sp.]